ncbi:hypothetical protein N0B44_01530 [Roseibacterium beibuensis]|uniref:Uncharacterized protein n=2 Tax=[Roseibacterium] beibuensis TaxID=1193142 RepID=A0ABP9L025_9RHOB|nr:hypothetical protein [Roseibacterium beibuensis]
MPVDYRVLPEYNLVYVRYSGRAALDESFAVFGKFARDPLATPGQKHFVDLSKVTEIEEDFPKLIALQARKVGEFMRGLAPSMLLYFAPGPVPYAMARMVLRSWEGLDGPTVLVQQDEMMAFSLLGLPEMTLSDLAGRMA